MTKQKMNYFDINKVIWPVSILLSSIVIGYSIYAVQINKQESIAHENERKIEENRLTNESKLEQEKADKIFSNNLKCQTLLKELKQRWNNVVGIYYSDWQNSCVVKYTKNGIVEEGPVEGMQDSN